MQVAPDNTGAWLSRFDSKHRRSIAEIFRIHVVANPSVKSPILTLGSTTFFHVRHLNLYIACVTKGNVNAALVFEFCYRLISIGRSYFGKLDEESVKSNFVLIYELLDGVSTTQECVYMQV
jgi:AP-2 complex subunit mu-1